jgi:hypothetical protein
MTSYKDIERTSVKRSRCDDAIPRFPALESNLQEDGPALKPQPRKLSQSFKTISSSDFHPLTLRRVVTDEDTSSLLEDDYNYFSVKLEHDSTKEPSFGLNAEGSSSMSKYGCEDSLCLNAPTTYHRISQVFLRMRPMLTSNPFSHATFYDDEASYQPQLPPREVSMDTLNHENSVLVTPRPYRLSAGLLSPPPTPQEIERKDDTSITCIPNELCLPALY